MITFIWKATFITASSKRIRLDPAGASAIDVGDVALVLDNAPTPNLYIAVSGKQFMIFKIDGSNINSLTKKILRTGFSTMQVVSL